MAFIPLMVRGVKAIVNTRRYWRHAPGEAVFNRGAHPGTVPHASRASRRHSQSPWRSCGLCREPSALNLPSFSSAGSVAATGQTTTVQVKATSNYLHPAEVIARG